MTDAEFTAYAVSGLEADIARLTALLDRLRAHPATVTDLQEATDPRPRLHWTQRPENKARLRRVLRKANAARRDHATS